MNIRGFQLIVAAVTTGLFGGCVDRRYLVETNVPGAQITVDGKPIGPSPADGWYEYAGKYEFKAVAPGYEPLTKRINFRKHWYDYPGLDFFAEVLLPVRIEDVRHVQLELEPSRPINTAELIENADRLRAKGNGLPPQSVPEDVPNAPAMPQTPVPGRVIPPLVPPPFPTTTDPGVPATLPPDGPSINGSSFNPGGYGTFDR